MPAGVVASEFPSQFNLLPDVRLGPESIIPANRYVELSATDTQVLVKNLSALGRTVTHAFHAAVILVSRDWQHQHLIRDPDTKVIRHISHIPCDQRPFTPRNVVDPAAVHHRLSHKCIMVDMRASTNLPVLAPDWQDRPPPGVMSLNGRLGRIATLLFPGPNPKRSQEEQTEFRIVMQQIKKLYTEAEAGIKHDPLEISRSDMVTFLERSDQKPMVVFLPGMNNIDQIVRTQHGYLQIERPVITRYVLSRDIIMSVMIHENKLTLSASWNGPWHTQAWVKELIDNCVDKVFEGLGLECPVAAPSASLKDLVPPLDAKSRIEPEVPTVMPPHARLPWTMPPIRECLGAYF